MSSTLSPEQAAVVDSLSVVIDGTEQHGAPEPSAGQDVLPVAPDTCEAGPADRPLPTAEAGLPAGERLTRRLAALGVTAICLLICWHVTVRATMEIQEAWSAVYTFVVSTYVVSRFALAALYSPPRDRGIEPRVAIVVPAYNEGEAVVRTIDACLALDYPREKLEVVVVNDGSEDDTWEHMRRAEAAHPEGSVRCIDLGSNQGKRAAMAAGIRATSAEILLFVDSDSEPAPGALRLLVQAFADDRVGAVSGITHVRNATTNALTRMQAARYYVSYQLIKSAESVVGAVSCCPGCFSAYRRKAILPLLAGWEHQFFLGVECTYGDDRALTNRLLKSGWRTLYDSRAEAWTDAPFRYQKFFRQQLRWKKSWCREGPILMSHLWRTRPLAFPSVLVATLAGLASPVVILYNLIVHPALSGLFPLLYVDALAMVAMAYGLLHRSQRRDGNWIWAVLGTFFYVSFSPQLLWALARIRDGSWGTRAAA
ncbi:MAG TPA: glycosyltransferase [Kineosporiaceae bacterium]|nr:glycosyltransferase [Kineosporiaceae bacterium]